MSAACPMASKISRASQGEDRRMPSSLSCHVTGRRRAVANGAAFPTEVLILIRRLSLLESTHALAAALVDNIPSQREGTQDRDRRNHQGSITVHHEPPLTSDLTMKPGPQ